MSQVCIVYLRCWLVGLWAFMSRGTFFPLLHVGPVSYGIENTQRFEFNICEHLLCILNNVQFFERARELFYPPGKRTAGVVVPCFGNDFLIAVGQRIILSLYPANPVQTSASLWVSCGRQYASLSTESATQLGRRCDEIND